MLVRADLIVLNPSDLSSMSSVSNFSRGLINGNLAYNAVASCCVSMCSLIFIFGFVFDRFF